MPTSIEMPFVTMNSNKIVTRSILKKSGNRMVSLLLVSFLCLVTQGQEVSFNESKGLMINAQLAFEVSSNTALAPMIGYKHKRLIYFLGYERKNAELEFDIGTPDDNISITENSIKVGGQIFPFRNEKRTRVFFQMHVNYEWDSEKIDKKAYFINFGSGIEYALSDKFACGMDTFWGVGNEKEYLIDYEGIVYDIGLNISFKYYLFPRRK